MFSLLKTDENIQSNERKLQELLIRFEQTENELNHFLNEIGLTPQQAEIYVSNKQNFSESEWEELQKQKKAMEEKLQRDLDNIRDPAKSQKTYSEQSQLDPRWLFVR
jgi:hypothetical protein